ncbi:MAG: NAD(+)/NADH kinase [Clostridia bacterium]|nr:NAD(+)/NADH kinase [Clostridia bacterium]
MKIAILSNVIKSNPTEAARAFLEVVKDECEIFIANELKGIIPAKEYYTDDELFKKADVAVVFGGDGTTLSAARRAAPFNVPVLSINTGHLGFLATVSAQDAKKAAEALLKDNLTLSERTMLSVSVKKENGEAFNAYSLNDAVISRSSGKLCKLNVFYNGSFAQECRSDGVIVSTPTGSTAYSLSCGGPLVMPGLDLFIISPICPHFLGSRPMIVPSDETIEIKLTGDCTEALLSTDGISNYTISPKDTVTISKAPYKAKLLTLKEQNFFNLVRQKLTLM